MRSVKSKDTGPEMTVRRFLHSLGYRYRLCVQSLPGKPDLVLPKYRTVIFVHGCFWHRHKGCCHATMPETNLDYWLPKFARTVDRDKENEKSLRLLGWRVLTLWECDIRAFDKVKKNLEAILMK